MLTFLDYTKATTSFLETSLLPSSLNLSSMHVSESFPQNSSFPHPHWLEPSLHTFVYTVEAGFGSEPTPALTMRLIHSWCWVIVLGGLTSTDHDALLVLVLLASCPK